MAASSDFCGHQTRLSVNHCSSSHSAPWQHSESTTAARRGRGLCPPASAASGDGPWVVRRDAHHHASTASKATAQLAPPTPPAVPGAASYSSTFSACSMQGWPSARSDCDAPCCCDTRRLLYSTHRTRLRSRTLRGHVHSVDTHEGQRGEPTCP